MRTPLGGLVAVAMESRPIRVVGFVALMAVGTLSLRISLTNAFFYVNWVDAISYAEGARHAYTSMSPYSEIQLAGPYALDEIIAGLGFVYPPSGAYLLLPFALGEGFWYVWNVLSIVALIGIVLLMVRREVGHLTVLMTLAVGAIAVTAFQVGITDLKTGYLSPMVAAVMGSMWLWPRWSAIPSLAFGLVKVFPAAGMLWAIRKRGIWKVPLVIAVMIGAAVTVAHPSWLADWLTALANAEPACPEYALPSFACVGLPPFVGYLAAVLLLFASWRAKRDDVSFLLLGLAMTAPLPDIYWGNVMVPMIAAIPLVTHESRRWLGRDVERPPDVGGVVGRTVPGSASSNE